MLQRRDVLGAIAVLAIAAAAFVIWNITFPLTGSTGTGGNRTPEVRFSDVYSVPDPLALRRTLRDRDISPGRYIRRAISCDDAPTVLSVGSMTYSWSRVTQSPAACKSAISEIVQRVQRASVASVGRQQNTLHEAVRKLRREHGGLLLFDFHVLGSPVPPPLPHPSRNEGVPAQQVASSSTASPEEPTFSFTYPFGTSPQSITLPFLLLLVMIGGALFLYWRWKKARERKDEARDRIRRALSSGRSKLGGMAGIVLMLTLTPLSTAAQSTAAQDTATQNAVVEAASCLNLHHLVVDISKSARAETVPVARHIVAKRARRGCATSLSVFGDSVATADTVASESAFNALMDNTPGASHTELRAALCQTARRARRHPATYVMISDFIADPASEDSLTATCDLPPPPPQQLDSGRQASVPSVFMLVGGGLAALLLGALLTWMVFHWLVLPRRTAEAASMEQNQMHEQMTVEVILDDERVADFSLRDVRRDANVIVAESLLAPVSLNGDSLSLSRLEVISEQGESPRLKFQLST